MKVEHRTIQQVMDELASLQRRDDLSAILDIKKEKPTSKTLSEKQYMDFLGGIIIVMDVDQKIVLINKKGQEVLKCGDGEYIGKNWVDNFIPEKTRAWVKEAFTNLILGKGENMEYYENLVLTKDGEERIVAWHNTILYNDAGEIVGTLSSGVDVTNYRITEELLRNSEQEKKLILHNITELVVYQDKDMKVLWVNAAARKSVNLALGDMVGRHCYDIWHNRNKPCKDCAVAKAVRSGQAHESEVTSPNGRIWLIKGYPVKDGDGNVRGAVEVTTDITEQRKVKETVKESEKKYRTIFNAANDGMVILDLKTVRIIDVNDEMCRMLGYNAEELKRMQVGDFSLGEAPYSQKEAVEKVKSATNGKPQIFEWICKKKNKELFWVEVSLNSIDLGGRGYIIAIVRDIDSRKKIEKKTEELNRDLSKFNRKLQRLALKDLQTGLYNHRYFEKLIDSEFYRAKRYNSPLSLIMVDIDYFKSINDVYGHRFGDMVLKQFAKKLRRLVRLHDYVIRFGGEEFIIIMPGSDKAGCLNSGHRILNSIRMCKFGDTKNNVKLRLSLAAVSYPDDDIFRSMDFIGVADKVLNKVKEVGGDRFFSIADIKGKNPKGKSRNGRNLSVKYLKQKLLRLTKKSNQSLVESIFAFAKTIELKDQYTGDHVENTVSYATHIARKVGLSETDVILIEQASMLHDLGKIGISEKILLKRGKLTRKEFEKIKEHPMIGVDIIRPVQFLRSLVPLILHHHERWDGKGYPFGLKGKEIPVGARIIAIADVYQALISDRPYRKAIPIEKAISIIEKNSGTQFEPKIAAIFLQILKKDF